jgi:hypothetical protein
MPRPRTKTLFSMIDEAYALAATLEDVAGRIESRLEDRDPEEDGFTTARDCLDAINDARYCLEGLAFDEGVDER